MYDRTLNGRSRTETGIEGNGMGMAFASTPQIKCQEQEMARGSWGPVSTILLRGPQTAWERLRDHASSEPDWE
jgi:hypothetical protein